MKKTKKALASLAIASMVVSAVPFNALADTATTRIFGSDRIQTAISVAQQGWTTANTVIVAPAADKNLVDALAAAPLAGQENAPILLTDGAALDAQTKQEITALGATKVFAVGALSDQVINDLKTISGLNVVQLKGADRIETATKIAEKLNAPAGSFVVGYSALADALSVASYAAANNYEILVANPDGTLPSSEAPVGTKYVIGGPTLVGDVAGATRIYGQDRYDTNNQVIQTLGSDFNTVFVANGENAHLVDSLVASAFAAKTKSMIALTDNSSVKATGFLGGKMTDSSKTIALGGEGVVSETVRSAVKAGATDVTPPATGNVGVTGVATPGRSVGAIEKLVKVATLNVNAAEASTLTGVKIQRSGLSADSDIESVVVYDGANRLNVPAVIGDGVADFNFTNPLQLAAGQTKALDVYMNMNAVTGGAQVSGKQIALTIQEVRGSNVTGFTPLTSNVFTTAAVDLGQLTVSEGTGYPTTDIDPNGQPSTLLSKYKFEANKEDIKLNRIVLTQNGSAGSQDITDLELWNGTTKIAGPISLDAGRTAAFTLADGLIVKNGASVTLDLKAKVVGGSGRDVEFDLQDGVDVLGQGQTYGTSVVSPAKMTVHKRGISEGKLIVSTDSTNPVAATVAQDTKDVVFGVAKVQAQGEDIQLRKIVIGASTTPASVTDSGTTTNLKTLLQNVKLISGDTTIGTSTDGFNGTLNSSGNLEISLTKPITVKANETAAIKVTADIKKSTLWAPGNSIKFTFVGTEFARLTSGTTDTAGSTTNPLNNVGFNVMSIGDQGVTATQVAVSDFNIYSGQSNVVLASFDLKQNLTDPVNLNSLAFYNGSTATTAALSTLGFADFNNLKLEDSDGNVISDTIANPSGAPRLTLKTPLAIAPNATVRVKLVADVKSTTTTNANHFGIVDSIDATNSVNGNEVTLKTRADVPGNVTATIAAQRNTHLVNPVYSTYFDINGEKTVMASSKDVKVGAWTLYNPKIASSTTPGAVAMTDTSAGSSFSNEMVTVKSIKISNAGTDLDNAKYGNIRIVDKAGNVLGTASGFAAGEHTLKIDLDKPLDIDYGYTKSVDIAVLADITAGSGDYGKKLQLEIGAADGSTPSIEATTKYSGVNADISFGAINSAKPGTPGSFAFFKVAPAVVAVKAETVADPKTTGGLISDGMQIAKFTFTNNGTDAINLNQLNINDTIGNALDGAKFKVYDAAKGVVIGESAVITTGAAIANLDTASMRIDPGASKSVIVRLDLTGVSAAFLAARVQAQAIALRVDDATSNFISFTDYATGGAAAQTNKFILDNDATMTQITVTTP